MASLIPISTYNLAVKPFNPVPAIDDDYPVTIRLTLAAVDPEALDDKEEPATLRLLKRSVPFIDSDEEDSDLEAEEGDELDSEEEEEEEEEKPKKKSKASKKAEEEEEDEEVAEDSDNEDDEDDISEFVVCTLSPKVQFQQTIDLTISPEEEVFFVVTGSYAVHLTGNYVEHPADEDSEDEEYDEDDYDLSPDEDEIIHGDGYDLEDLEDESDVENKIEELIEEEEEDKKNNKKRSAPEDSEEPASKKDSKKKKEDKKSVQFSKELEQGPTGSTLVDKKKEKKEKAKAKKEEAQAKKEESAEKEETSTKKFPTKTLLGGVITEDRKIGKGQTAKSGNRVGIRYIGKLKNGKVFDKNTSGKPFVFGLGKGECIKGFDLGVAGMAVGGERRVIIPAKMGYGSQALPGIPANSELTFDIKLVSLK